MSKQVTEAARSRWVSKRERLARQGRMLQLAEAANLGDAREGRKVVIKSVEVAEVFRKVAQLCCES